MRDNFIPLRLLFLFVALLFVSNCQKSDLQACVDAEMSMYRSERVEENGEPGTFWKSGKFEEDLARSVAFSICGHKLNPK
jgi:hypothetical protein